MRGSDHLARKHLDAVEAAAAGMRGDEAREIARAGEVTTGCVHVGIGLREPDALERAFSGVVVRQRNEVWFEVGYARAGFAHAERLQDLAPYHVLPTVAPPRIQHETQDVVAKIAVLELSRS